MSYHNYARFNFARYREAYRLLDNRDTHQAGAYILRDMLQSQPSIGPWLRMKCNLMLTYHADDIEAAEAHLNTAQHIYDVLCRQPPETRSEQRTAQLPDVGRGIEQARAWIDRWRENIRNAIAAREVQLQDEAASQTTQEKALTEIADEFASVENGDEVDDDENIQPAQDSAT